MQRESQKISLTLLLGVLSLGIFFSFAATRARAEDKKKPEPKPVPKILMSLPLAVTRGSTAKLTLRGKALADATDVQADIHGTTLHPKIKSKGKADLPKPELADRLGDTQIEVELEIPADATGDEVKLTVTAPNGTSEAHAVRLYNPADLVPEKEPNNGFKTAQEISTPTTVLGVVNKENDVDVYRIAGKSGQKLLAEVSAARLGSALDSLITVYDEHGQIVATNDDTDTADSLLNIPLPHDGVYFISLTDAMGAGGATYPYLLHVELK